MSRSLRNTFLISVVIFVTLLFLVPANLIKSDYGNTILTITTFLFGIFGGFCVAVTTTDYNSIRSLAAQETAAWISLYESVKIYHSNSSKKLKTLLEHYIIRSFDYDFINYARETKKEFETISAFIRRLPYLTASSSTHQNILNLSANLVTYRQQLTALGKRSLSPLEWIVLDVLAIIVITTLYGLRTGSLFFDFVTVAVSSSTILILVLIRDIDRYTWNDSTFSFEVFNNVLLTLGELPYYPLEFIEQGIVTPTEKVYRVGVLKRAGISWERSFEKRNAKNL